ncbi:uncharacterized protein LOC135834075 [Planococcus citri]|uniref:uncharacterized protein LOC135834075 n=1 Tax=Planococcus citri TaxID=170843 RepID=UPI0031F75FBE
MDFFRSKKRDSCCNRRCSTKKAPVTKSALPLSTRKNMERFVGKVAVVTGASSGFGAETSKLLVKHGVIVVGLARRIERLQELSAEMENSDEYSGKFHPLKCDLTSEEEIQSSFKQIFDEIGPVSILVNNAGVMDLSLLSEISSDGFDKLFNTNVKAVLLCSKEAIKNMVDNSIAGHIININSVLGHVIVDAEPNLYIPYSSTKHAVRVISEGLRREMISNNSNIKVTNLSPGYAATDFTLGDDFAPRSGYSALRAEDIANACICVLNTPPEVLISELTVRPLYQRLMYSYILLLRCNVMERFANRVAVVTGSSSGIGSAISTELVKYGIIVVGVARRIENLQKLADELNEPGKPVRFYPVKCDVTVESEIENSFKWITSELSGIAVLINCAGTSHQTLLRDAHGESISQIFDTNVKASILCSKLAVESMMKNSIPGHIININSILSHVISNVDMFKRHQIYSASKHALKVISGALRQELLDQKLNIKVTNLSPGIVATELTRRHLPTIDSLPSTDVMQPKDVADACVYVLSTPENVLVSELTIMPLHQKF